MNFRISFQKHNFLLFYFVVPKLFIALRTIVHENTSPRVNLILVGQENSAAKEFKFHGKGK